MSQRDVIGWNALISAYSRNGHLEEARALFERMPRRNTASWNAIITAFGKHGHGQAALLFFHSMLHDPHHGHSRFVQPNQITFLCALEVCAGMGSLEEGRKVHAAISLRHEVGDTPRDLVLDTALVNMYSKCGSLDDARRVFDTMPHRNVVSWTTMVSSYARCGRLADARELFDSMPSRNVVSWTSLISAYAQHGQSKEALRLSQHMDEEGVKPNKITFLSIIDACESLEALEHGKLTHAKLIHGEVESDVVLGTALVTMYGKCGSLPDARKVFDRMGMDRNVISWNAMIAAYAQNGKGEEALAMLLAMDSDPGGVRPNRITCISALDACADAAALELGRTVHAVVSDGGWETDTTVGNALVTMYGKCGSLKYAKRTFDRMSQHNAISWNAMIAAYAHNGLGDMVLSTYRLMTREEGVKPNLITFVSILTACSHAGLLDDGWRCFVSMFKDHRIVPSLEHYVCMVDLLGRAGHLNKVEDFIGDMSFEPPFEHHSMAWMCLLGACRLHKDVDRGARAAEHMHCFKASFHIP